MNFYVRYFDHETLATNMDEIVEFLSTINEIHIDDNIIDRILNFIQSSNVYPFRLKVSFSNYVLFLKTDAKDLEEFKYREQMRKEQRIEGNTLIADRKQGILEILNEEHIGWYESSIIFKRVVLNPETNKCQYVDTPFCVRLKAKSAIDCYNRIVEHLKNRQDVDPRSQFPSVKSANFTYRFLDDKKDSAPQNEDAAPTNNEVVNEKAAPAKTVNPTLDSMQASSDTQIEAEPANDLSTSVFDDTL